MCYPSREASNTILSAVIGMNLFSTYVRVVVNPQHLHYLNIYEQPMKSLVVPIKTSDAKADIGASSRPNVEGSSNVASGDSTSYLPSRKIHEQLYQGINNSLLEYFGDGYNVDLNQ